MCWERIEDEEGRGDNALSLENQPGLLCVGGVLGELVGFGGRRVFLGHRGMMSVGFCLGLGGQKWRFKPSSDGGAGESWCGMLSSQTPTTPGFPWLKHEQIIPLPTHGLFQGNVGRFALGEGTGMDFIAGIRVGAAPLCCPCCRQTWHGSIPTGFVLSFQSKSHCLSS